MADAHSFARRLAKAKKHDGGKPLAVSMLEAAARLRVGHSTIKKLIRNGELETFKIGKSLRISVESLERLVARAARKRASNV